jgi:hypothetical protein
MLSEKQKQNVFKQCLQELRKTPEMNNYPELEDHYKDNRDRIISLTDDYPDDQYHLDKYKEKIIGVLDFINKSVVQFALEPIEEVHQDKIDNIIKNIKNLRADIKSGIVDLSKIEKNQIEEWGGAGVIISSDINREGGAGDLVVYTKHAKIITWLMFRLRDIASESINYLNKYELYGKIAENIQKYIQKNGETEESLKGLLTYLLDETIFLIKSCK